jgi:hypothetical protein
LTRARSCPSRDKRGRFTGITRKPHGCGRVQKAIRRAFIANHHRPLTIATFLEWANPRLRASWQYNNILDVLHRDYRSLGR